MALAVTAAEGRVRLDDPADRTTFRQWFTFLAEESYFRDPAALPREVNDCAALVRYSYRESLRKHDGRWAASLGLTTVPPFDSVRGLSYPFPARQAGLFYTNAGGAMAEFADAQTLLRHNTQRLSRDLEAAQPGDLLFFHQPAQRFPFHVMIYLGASHFDDSRQAYIVYHTGPIGAEPGEIRRPSTDELRRHPNPQWRPNAGNPYYLGVFRWNLLAD